MRIKRLPTSVISCVMSIELVCGNAGMKDDTILPNSEHAVMGSSPDKDGIKLSKYSDPWTDKH